MFFFYYLRVTGALNLRIEPPSGLIIFENEFEFLNFEVLNLNEYRQFGKPPGGLDPWLNPRAEGLCARAVPRVRQIFEALFLLLLSYYCYCYYLVFAEQSRAGILLFVIDVSAYL